MDINEISNRLADIQGQLAQLMQMIEPHKLIVDGLSSASPVEVGRVDRIEAPGGYLTISPEFGIFSGNGVALVEFEQSERGKVLRMLAVDGQASPSRIILQLNAEYTALRGRDLFDLEAQWTGPNGADPKLEVRMFGGTGILKRVAVNCYLHEADGTFSLRAPVQMSAAMMRSQAVQQVQFCLSFSQDILGADFSTLKVV